MIISFSVENWMSFRNRVSFSMIASREKHHKERLPFIDKYHTRILPVAAVYGGNASGKTNFFKALSFVKGFVLRGSQPDSLIPVDLFRLDSEGVDLPARFTMELLTEETVYEFSFAVTAKAVVEEKLVRVSSNKETVLYERHNENVYFDKSYKKDQFLQFAFKGTRDNQLFLTNSISQKLETFRPVYDWFKSNLRLVAPDSRFASFENFFDEGHPLYSTMNEMLSRLDTGIIYLGGEEIPFENLPFPERVKIKLKEDIREGETAQLQTEPINERFIITRENNKFITKKLVTYHPKSDGSNVKFDITQESDGSQRIIDLLPSFLEMSDPQSQKVYVIDEIDRSLHTLLTRRLLELYLTNCHPESRSQLLFTTHDVLLMDQQLLRRDEMWVAERDVFGISNIFSFSEYKDVRYDKDIQKSYLQGRLGGIPRILLGETLSSPCDTSESGGEE